MLAHSGVGSRRACEDYILQGRITINGETVRELGTKVVPGRDKVAVDGQPIHDERPAYIAVNKPKGYVSTNNDPTGRPRVVDLIPDIPQRVYTVGRLDEMSTGLMLLTNDGEMANRLAHPKFGVEKVYRAVVAGTPSAEVLQKLVEGVWLAEGKVRAKRAKAIAHKGDSTVMELVLAEGKNREVRRMFAKFGHKVMTLTRVAVGPITLKGLKPGGWRFLSAYEVDLLQKVAAGISIPTGRYGNDRPIRRPTRGPQAAGRPLGSRDDRGPGGPPSRDARRPMRRDDGPSRPQQGDGSYYGSDRRSDDRRSDGPPPRDYRRPAGQGSSDNRRPPRRDEGPPRPRPAHFESDAGRPRPPQGGDRRPMQGGERRPMQGGPRPPQSHSQSSGRPAPRRAPSQGGPVRPPREMPPSRRIIGMESQHDSSSNRPAPRKRPSSGPPRAGRPLPPRRPLGGDDNG